MIGPRRAQQAVDFPATRGAILTTGRVSRPMPSIEEIVQMMRDHFYSHSRNRHRVVGGAGVPQSGSVGYCKKSAPVANGCVKKCGWFTREDEFEGILKRFLDCAARASRKATHAADAGRCTRTNRCSKRCENSPCKTGYCVPPHDCYLFGKKERGGQARARSRSVVFQVRVSLPSVNSLKSGCVIGAQTIRYSSVSTLPRKQLQLILDALENGPSHFLPP